MRRLSAEHRRKIGESNRGKKCSDIQRMRMSQSRFKYLQEFGIAPPSPDVRGLRLEAPELDNTVTVRFLNG